MDADGHISLVIGEVPRGPSLLPPLHRVNFDLSDYLFIIRVSTLQSVIYLLSTLSIFSLRNLWENELLICDFSFIYAALEKL